MAKTNITFTKSDNGNYEAEVTIEADVARLHVELQEYGTLYLYEKDSEATNYAEVIGASPMFGQVIETSIPIDLAPIKIKLVSNSEVSEAFVRTE